MKILQVDKPIHKATLSCMILAGPKEENRYRKLRVPSEDDADSYGYDIEKHDIEWIISILRIQIKERPIFSTHGMEITQILSLWEGLNGKIFPPD
ncbi:MAG: hypothetical protein WC661_21865 [Opitutaceae bacterium]|jgi:hypothetical protein